MNEILTTGVVAVVSGAAGFLGSFFLLKKQLAESRKERVRDRKIGAATAAIDSACELLGAITEFSDIDKAIRRATQNEANIATAMEYPDLLSKLKAAQPGIHEVTARYRTTMARTWKAYAALRLSFPERVAKDYVEFTNHLNSLILEDIREKWAHMLAKANEMLDKVKNDIESS